MLENQLPENTLNILISAGALAILISMILFILSLKYQRRISNDIKIQKQLLEERKRLIKEMQQHREQYVEDFNRLISKVNNEFIKLITLDRKEDNSRKDIK